MVEEKEIEGILVFDNDIFFDDRGYFMEVFNKKRNKYHCLEEYSFAQDNISCSKKDVLRGLHFQAPPFEQGKLIHVLKGKVIDVVVDIRKKSKTYGKHLKIELSSQNHNQLWVPPGFAHGFLTIEEDTLFSYKCTNYYSKDHEMDLLWNDDDLNINWGIKNPIVSDKDQKATKFQDLNSPF